MDQPQRANAAQLAARAIKSVKSKHSRRPGAMIQKDASSTQWKSASTPSDGGLFGGNIQASGTFNFAAPSNLKLNPPPLTFGASTNTMSNVSENDNSKLEDSGRFYGDDRNLKRAFGQSAGPVARPEFQFSNIFSSGTSFGSTITPSASEKPGSSLQPSAFTGVTSASSAPIFSFGSTTQFPSNHNEASKSTLDSNGVENEKKEEKKIFHINNQESTQISSTPTFQFNTPAPENHLRTSPFKFGQVSVAPQPSNSIFGSSSATLGSANNPYPELRKNSISTENPNKSEVNIFNINNQQPTQNSSNSSFQFNSIAPQAQPGTSPFKFGQISAPSQPSKSIFDSSSAVFGSAGSNTSLFPAIGKNSSSSSLNPFSNSNPSPFLPNTTTITPTASNEASDSISGNSIKVSNLHESVSQPTHTSQFNSLQPMSYNQFSQQDVMKVDRESAGYPGENKAPIPFENIVSSENQATIQSKLNGLTPNIFAQANLPTNASSSFTGFNSSLMNQAIPTSKPAEMSPSNDNLISEDKGLHQSGTQQNVGSASKKHVNGGDTKGDRASSTRTPKEELFKRLALASQIKEEAMIDKLPPGLDENGKKQFFAAFRIRALNQAMGKLFVELQVAADPQIALEFYTEERRIILSEFPESSSKPKRKADSDEVDDRNNPKKRKQNEPISQPEPLDTKLSKSSTKRKYAEDEDEDLETQNLKKRNKNLSTTTQLDSNGSHLSEKEINLPTPETVSPPPAASRCIDKSITQEKPEPTSPNSPKKSKQITYNNSDQGTSTSCLKESNTAIKFRSILENNSSSSISNTSKSPKGSSHIEDSNSPPKPQSPSLVNSNGLSTPPPILTALDSNSSPSDKNSLTTKKKVELSLPQVDTTNFKAQFDSQAKDAEARQMENDKLEEMDSDEDEEKWEAKWKAKRLAKAKEIEKLAKSKKVAFIPGKGFVMQDTNTGDSSTSSESSIDSCSKLDAPPPVSSTPSQEKFPGNNSKPSIFGSVSSMSDTKDNFIPTEKGDKDTTITKNPFMASQNIFANPQIKSSYSDQTWKPDSPIRFGAPTSSDNPIKGISNSASANSLKSPKVFGSLQTPGTNKFPFLDASKPSSSFQLQPSKDLSAQSVFGKKPESPFTPAFSQPSLSGSFSGFSAIKPASTSTGSIFGQPSEISSFTSIVASSQSTSNEKEETTETHHENNDDHDGENQEQIDLTAIGPGEENEEVVHEVRVKALKLTPKDENNSSTQWLAKGVGPLRVLKHNLSGISRLLIRADPSGKVILNKMILGNVKYESTDKKVKILTASDSGNGLETWILQVKTEEFATKLASVLEEHKMTT